MKPPKLLLTFVAILAPARLFADGGTVQLRKEAGALLITVFTSPSPLSAGPADVSLLLQTAKWARSGTGCRCLYAAPDRRVGHRNHGAADPTAGAEQAPLCRPRDTFRIR